MINNYKLFLNKNKIKVKIISLVDIEFIGLNVILKYL